MKLSQRRRGSPSPLYPAWTDDDSRDVPDAAGLAFAALHKYNCRDAQKQSQALFCAPHHRRRPSRILNSKRPINQSFIIADPLSEHSMAESLRIIKKYPNRRLYDTANSGYITLAD